MHVSVRRYSMSGGSIDALMHRIDEEFVPAIAQEPGFLSYFTVRTGPSSYLTISVFADEAAAQRSDDLAAEYTADNLGEFGLTRTELVGGDVLVSRATPAMLDEVHRWRAARARQRIGAAGEAPVLVLGATGRTGRQIVKSLVARNVPVRALVRDRDKAQHVLGPEVKLFAGDVLAPETLAAPLAGAGAVVIATAGGTEAANSPLMVDFFGTRNVVTQAVRAGVELIVFVSSVYATRADHYLDVDPMSLGWKARAEELVRDSGVAYTIVRSGWLTDGPAGEPLVLTQGDTGEGHLSRADLARVCTDVLSLEDARRKTFEVITAHEAEGVDLAAGIAALAPDRVAEPA